MKHSSHRVLSISMWADSDHAPGTVGMTKQRWVRHWLLCRENFPRPSEEKHSGLLWPLAPRWRGAEFLCNNMILRLERSKASDNGVRCFKRNHRETMACRATSCGAVSFGVTFNGGWLKGLEWGCALLCHLWLFVYVYRFVQWTECPVLCNCY